MGPDTVHTVWLGVQSTNEAHCLLDTRYIILLLVSMFLARDGEFSGHLRPVRRFSRYVTPETL